MSRARVSAATLNRLAELEKPNAQRRGGLLIVPRILGIDEWTTEALAYYAGRKEAEEADRRISDANYERATAAPSIEPVAAKPVRHNTYDT